jgi:Transposase DDE domain group 1
VGETRDRPFQLSFNSSLKVDFQGSRVTSDGGLVLVRELDERLGLSELMERHLSDSRRGKNIQLPLADLLRQSIYSRLAGYEDVNDAAPLSRSDLPADRLAEDLGARGSVDLPFAIVRNRSADTSRQPRRAGRAQSRADRQGRSYRFVSAYRARYGQY